MEQGYHVRADQSLDCTFKKKEKEGFFMMYNSGNTKPLFIEWTQAPLLHKKNNNKIKTLTFVAASPGHRLQNKIGNPYM